MRWPGEDVGIAIEKLLCHTSHGRFPKCTLEKFQLFFVILLDDHPEELFLISKSKIEAWRRDAHSTGEISKRCAFVALFARKVQSPS